MMTKAATKKSTTTGRSEKKSTVPRTAAGKKTEQTVDEYIINQSPDAILALTTLRKRINKLLPQAEEVIWYNVPTYKIDGKPIFCFAGFKNHCSIVTMNAEAIKALKPLLGDYKISGTTIHFDSRKVPSAEILKKLIFVRMAQI